MTPSYAADGLSASEQQPSLRHALSLPLLVLYGLGVRIGAGIYVLVGATAGRAGIYAPVAFCLAALVMAPTAASFAELCGRMPFSAGEGAYVRAGFSSPGLGLLAGLMVATAGIVSSAAVAIGSAGYIRVFADIPGSVVIATVVLAMGAAAAWGIIESVSLAGIFTLLEVGGLALIVAASLYHEPALILRLPEVFPHSLDTTVWVGIFSAGLLAFFAFVGFEDLVNVAEETRKPERTLPRAIFLTLSLSTLIYFAVASVAVLVIPADELAASAAPLSDLYQRITDGSPLVACALPATMSIAQEPAKLLRKAPVAPLPPLFDDTAIDTATTALDGIVKKAMERTGVPGVAVGVVYKDKVIYAKGFGVREVGKEGAIASDTRFLLASVSKPIASTIVAKLVGDGVIKWDDPAKTHNPTFALNDPYVTAHATIADLMSHRSGLRTGAGDLLEDIGFDRAYILSHLDQQPLDPFRVTYHYSNFGYTAGGIAAAAAAGKSWEDLAEEILFEPTGMTTASYRHADYLADEDRARIHVRQKDGTWAALYDRDPDAEAPAGGASASLNDMLRFLRLQLGGGTLEGKVIVDEDALAQSHVPQIISAPPPSPAARSGFYGYGWNVSYDNEGRALIGHSGAFDLGSATNITFMPGEDLGIVVLTNGQPLGVAEAVGAAFLDMARNGKQTVDWVGFMGGIFETMKAAEAPRVDYTQAPRDPKPAQKLAAYVGSYGNSYYGPLVVSEEGGELSMTLGPQAKPTTFALTHFDGDTFSFETIGENANGLAGAIFTMGEGDEASKVVLDFYDRTGLGTFVRE